MSNGAQFACDGESHHYNGVVLNVSTVLDKNLSKDKESCVM